MVKIALLALGEYQTITEKGRKRTNREGKKARRKERNRGRKEGGKCCGLSLVGKEFPDMRQNERRIEFIRVGDSQFKGEPTPYVSW